MNWIWWAEGIPRILDYAADLGVAAVVAYAVAFIPIALGPWRRRARRQPNGSLPVAGLSRELTDLEQSSA